MDMIDCKPWVPESVVLRHGEVINYMEENSMSIEDMRVNIKVAVLFVNVYLMMKVERVDDE